MSYTKINIDNTTFSFHSDAIAASPKLTTFLSSCLVKTNVPHEYQHLNTLNKACRGIRIIPMIDISSHYDVYIVIKLAQALEISMDKLLDAFIGWTEHDHWMSLVRPEYMYFVYMLVPCLVDFNKFFSQYKNEDEPGKTAIDDIIPMFDKPEMNLNIRLSAIKFLENFDFNQCFDNNDKTVQRSIKELTKARNKYWRYFMINPYDVEPQYFEHNKPLTDVWSSDKISIVPPIRSGDITIASQPEVARRLHEFTYGLLEKSINPKCDVDFPLSNVVFAGGAVTKLMASNYTQRIVRQSDLDMFIIGQNNNERSEAVNRVLKWFYDPGNTYYAIRGSVVTIYIKNINRKFQLISINYSNPHEVVSRFDLTHIQWALYCGEYLGTANAFESAKSQITKFNNVSRLRANRLIKALYCGYDIEKAEKIIEECMDITELVDNPTGAQITKIIQGFCGGYCPRSENMDPDEERNYILCMIEKDSNATLVGDTPTFVANNITIGGNFESDYESVLFSTFRPEMIVNNIQARRVNKITARSKNGAIRLTTCMLKVSKVSNTENGLEITAKCTDQTFKEFCNQTLEATVFRLFRAGGVTKHILNADCDLKFTISKASLNQYTNRGITHLKTQRGEPLNIEEDLKPDDDIQVLFAIDIEMYPQERGVVLRPHKFVKYQQVDIIDTEDKQIIPQTDAKFDGDIKYEDYL